MFKSDHKAPDVGVFIRLPHDWEVSVSRRREGEGVE